MKKSFALPISLFVVAMLIVQSLLLPPVRASRTSGQIMPAMEGVGAGLQFYLMSPSRLIDTRPGQAACFNTGAPLVGGMTLNQNVGGMCGIPASARAYAFNVTVLPIADASSVTLWPSGQPQPSAPILSGIAGQATSNFAIVPAGADGAINVSASSTTNIALDITGYFAPVGPGGLYYYPLSRPARLLNTQPGQAACSNTGAPLAGGAPRTQNMRVTCDRTDIPASARAYAFNVTVLPIADASSVTLWPSGQPQPSAPILSGIAGQATSNFAIVPSSSNGAIIISASSPTHFALDVNGYFSPEPVDANGAGLLFTPLPNPANLLDTRSGQAACFNTGAPLAGDTTRIQPARVTCGVSNIPASAQAIVGNSTVANPSASGFISLYPSNASRPLATNLSYSANRTGSNGFITGLGSDGAFKIYTSAQTNYVVNVSGYFGVGPNPMLRVTNTSDSGLGTLRQAIVDANNTPGLDTIGFDVGGGGMQSIALLSPLPMITDGLVIDGTTQPGYRGTPLIILNGAGAGAGADGFNIKAGNSIVKGLAIQRFAGNGISIIDVNTGKTLVQSNSIGTVADGTTTDPDGVPNSGDETGNMGEGLRVSNSSNVLVGGIGPGAGNIIGGNGDGMSIINSNNSSVQGNWIGKGPLGSNIGNLGAGIGLAGNSSNNLIGGTDAPASNVIGNNGFGIVAFTGALNNALIFNQYFNNDAEPVVTPGVASTSLNSAAASATDTAVEGRLDGPPNRPFLVQFYWSTRLHSSGKGQGLPLGGITLTTGNTGAVTFNPRIPTPLAGGSFVSALATDLTTNSTTRFSQGVQVMGAGEPDLELMKSGPETALCDQEITYTLTVRNVGTAAAIGAMARDNLSPCIKEIEVASSQGALEAKDISGPGGSFFNVSSFLGRIDPGASATVTIKARLSRDCPRNIANNGSVRARGDNNSANDIDMASTQVDCPMITGISVQGKHVTVNGIGFQKGDMIEINGLFAKKTKFIDVDELFAKKGNRLLLPCDPANPGRTNVIRLIRSRNPGSPVLDTQAFATCPGG